MTKLVRSKLLHFFFHCELEKMCSYIGIDRLPTLKLYIELLRQLFEIYCSTTEYETYFDLFTPSGAYFDRSQSQNI